MNSKLAKKARRIAEEKVAKLESSITEKLTKDFTGAVTAEVRKQINALSLRQRIKFAFMVLMRKA